MKVSTYKNNKAREIIEDAISQLYALGMTNDGPASLLVIQGAIRVESRAKRKELADFMTECAEEPSYE